MLVVNIQVSEKYDEEANLFIPVAVPVAFEHSLRSISLWEAKFEKPFLTDKDEKSSEELYEYMKMMVVNPAVTDDLLKFLSKDNVLEIQNYIGGKHTATWFSERTNKSKGPSEVITSEVIYYWMFSYQIPIECELWPLNKLLTLIRVFGVKNDTDKNKKKMSKSDLLARNHKLNEERKAKLKTRG